MKEVKFLFWLRQKIGASFQAEGRGALYSTKLRQLGGAADHAASNSSEGGSRWKTAAEPGLTMERALSHYKRITRVGTWDQLTGRSWAPLIG